MSSRDVFDAWRENIPLTAPERTSAWLAWQARDAEIAALRAQAAGMREAALAAINTLRLKPCMELRGMETAVWQSAMFYVDAAIRALPPECEPDVEKAAQHIVTNIDFWEQEAAQGDDMMRFARAILAAAGWRGGDGD